MDKTKIQTSIARNLEATDAEIERFVLSLSKFLDQSFRKILKGKLDGSPKEAAIYLGSIMTRLVDAGLEDKVAEMERIFSHELGAVKEAFDATLGEPLRFSDSDLTDIDTLITFNEQRVLSTVGSYVDDTKAALYSNIVTGSVPDLDEISADLSDRIQRDVQTELNTSAIAFNRAVTAAKANDLGLDLWLYIGPDDKITRDFCKEVLNGTIDNKKRSVPVYTTAEIQDMDNDQGLDVLVYGGGYNCRHQWRPITRDLAEKLGYAD